MSIVSVLFVVFGDSFIGSFVLSVSVPSVFVLIALSVFMSFVSFVSCSFMSLATFASLSFSTL